MLTKVLHIHSWIKKILANPTHGSNQFLEISNICYLYPLEVVLIKRRTYTWAKPFFTFLTYFYPHVCVSQWSTIATLSSNIHDSVRALKALKLPTDKWDHWLIFVLTSKLDNESIKLWRRECSQRVSGVEITFSNLTSFVNNRIYELSPMKVGKTI